MPDEFGKTTLVLGVGFVQRVPNDERDMEDRRDKRTW